MKNEYPGRCACCRAWVEKGAGEMVRLRGGRLVLYAAKHVDRVFSDAQRFAVKQDGPPPDGSQAYREFPDGSRARWNGERWWASA